MYPNYAFYQLSSAKSGKLFSVTNTGKLKFNSMNEMHSYLLSQDLNFYIYCKEDKAQDYYIQAAQVMISIGMNKRAIQCYYQALWHASRNYTASLLYERYEYNSISPNEIYEMAAMHLFKMGCMDKLKQFKRMLKREADYYSLEMELRDKHIIQDRLSKIEERLDPTAS